MNKFSPLKSTPIGKIIGFIFVMTSFLACEKDSYEDCNHNHQGVLKNFTGLDGCGWIIQLADSSRIEPINLNDFEIELTENKLVCVQFHERTDLGSYCMVGKIVEIEFIE